MSKQKSVFISSAAAAEMFGLNLKHRWLAALLAWLVPGLGHFYQGRTAKGALFMICIVSTFLFGVYVAKGKGETMVNVAYASTGSMSLPRSLSQVIKFGGAHWKFVCQSGIGSVCLPALLQRSRAIQGEAPLFGGFLRPPRGPSQGPFRSTDSAGNTVQHPDELAQWNYDLGFYFELGAMYTIVAGLLNILVVYDAASGPLIVLQQDTPEDEQERADKPSKSLGDAPE